MRTERGERISVGGEKWDLVEADGLSRSRTYWGMEPEWSRVIFPAFTEAGPGEAPC